MSAVTPLLLLWLPALVAGLLAAIGRIPLHSGLAVVIGLLGSCLLAAVCVPTANILFNSISYSVLLCIYIVPVVALAVVSAFRIRDRLALPPPASIADKLSFPSRADLGSFAILAYIALRFRQLVIEATARPLLAWDAWHSWAAKAKVWTTTQTLQAFNQMHLTDQILPAGYFTQAKHPDTLPWLLTWFSILGGGWKEERLGWLYISLFIGLGILVYSLVRQLNGNRLASSFAVLFVLSLPYLNVHVALPGYADLWLATYFVCGATLVHIGAGTRHQQCSLVWAGLLVCILGASLLKSTGIVWAAILIGGVVVAVMPRISWVIYAGLIGCVGWIVLLNPDRVWLPIGPKFWSIQFQDVSQSLLGSLFTFQDWHLLWWLLIFTLILSPFMAQFLRRMRALTVMVSCSVTFLFVGFYYSSRSSWVEDFTAVNRALLPFALMAATWLVIFWVTGLQDNRRAGRETAQSEGAASS